MAASVTINDTGTTCTVTVNESAVQIGGPTSTAHNQLALRSDSDAHPASAITNTPAGNISATTVQAAINELDSDKSNIPIVASGNFTAANNGTYVAVATLTVTDPSPVEGSGFQLIVRNGTSTVGGTAYGVGLRIERYYHSGAWANRVRPALDTANTWTAAQSISDTTASTTTGTGAQTIAGGLGVGGQTTTRREAYAVATISTTGAIASLASDDGFTRLTGAAPSVQGIANSGTVARRLVLYCVNATTLRHENVTAAAADRITSDTGADISVAAGRTIELIYDPTSSRWRPIRF